MLGYRLVRRWKPLQVTFLHSLRLLAIMDMVFGMLLGYCGPHRKAFGISFSINIARVLEAWFFHYQVSVLSTSQHDTC